jgi:hypothetical protein
MAPEDEARTRVLYDHESDEPRRRRHAAADWGVAEDIFDRMPSRRFTRAERRAAHYDAEPAAPGESRTIVIAADPAPAAEPAAPGESRTIVIGADPAPAAEPRRAAAPPAGRSVVVTGGDRAPRAELRRTAPESPAPAAGAPAGRRTVLITGHPERLPAPRPSRPSRTAVERIGTSPDRIVAYAVVLGFLLVLIAVLTTGQ